MKKVILQRKNDKWHVNCGLLTRTETEERLKWCYESWEGHWGELDHSFGRACFIFHREEHATWFVLKWAD